MGEGLDTACSLWCPACGHKTTLCSDVPQATAELSEHVAAEHPEWRVVDGPWGLPNLVTDGDGDA